ncbi:NADPH-dependent oxidoreductase [Enterococcus saigonensis]|uniref:NADPH-dependent oxidoreductase n=1 Tax=Enterococcus saigonensis TaxID=1805431 RepID=A0A679IF91_9ENTE|nr:nitroreductase family protein [Enterococcus saigonensis]BCA86793.1 NADPH-dependent oxidoreductase [Enterococcus saigonensis]
MNTIIEQLKSHRSYRHFDENYTLTQNQLQEILDASRQAPSWMNGQAYSIIVVQNQALREKLVTLNPNNPHMLHSSVFLLFVANLKRTQMVAVKNKVPYAITDSLNPLLIATTDASLALQNAVIAVEALGLGSVVVGSVRNHITEISTLFNLPDYVYPVAGLSIGKPTVEMHIKPRLPEETVVHYDTYQEYDYQLIEDYDQIMEEFAEARETKSWTKKFADYYKEARNSELNSYLKEQKLL